jgi:O-antigen ligase
MSKLEKIIFYTFLFLIPFQIRTALFWGGNEWNSVFLYLTDFLFVGVLILGFLRRGIKFKKIDFILAAFLLIVAISLFVASNTEIGIYRFIKVAEFGLLFLYVVRSSTSLGTIKIYKILIASGLLQAILAIAQFLKQGSLGIKFIEAGIFDPNLPGVANFMLNGERVMRVYGSFPHPNVLAGFLLLCIFAFYALWLNKDKKSLFLISYFLFLIFALFLTFSRVALAVFLFASLIFFLVRIFYLRRQKHTQERILIGKKLVRLFGLFLVSCVLCVIILFPHLKARFFTISFEEQAIDLRFFYNKMALAMIKEKPVLGVGIGNFVWHSQNYETFLIAASKIASMVGQGGEGREIPDWVYQPVHNIYLLIGAELGFLGLLAFLLFIAVKLRLIKLIRRIGQIGPIAVLFIIFLIVGLTDHYFWTLHSGGIMFWLALGLIEL